MLDQIFDQFKKGIRTTEFWLVMIAALYNGVYGIVDPSRPFREQIPGLVVAGVSAVYAAARTWLKTRRAEVVAATPAYFAPPTAPRPYTGGGVPTA